MKQHILTAIALSTLAAILSVPSVNAEVSIGCPPVGVPERTEITVSAIVVDSVSIGIGGGGVTGGVATPGVSVGPTRICLPVSL